MTLNRFEYVQVAANGELVNCVVISDTIMNQRLDTVIVAPLIYQDTGYKFRVAIEKDGDIVELALDKLRAIKKSIIKPSNKFISRSEAKLTLQTIQDLFA